MANNGIIKSHSEREIELIRPMVEKIELLQPTMSKLSDEELRDKHIEFRQRLAEGETLDDLLTEAFAVVREATDRVMHTPHYPEQLMGGILLHQGRVAQMMTGEGKTQTCMLPAYLNALEGKGVHVVSCNDYLSARDAEDMGRVYNFLGLTVGSITSRSKLDQRRQAYGKDITYVSNVELAFDYLRDKMALYKENLVLRGLNYTIIDEVDSVLIDSARSSLRVSGKNDEDLSLYQPADEFVKTLEAGDEQEELTKFDLAFGGEIEETGDYILNSKNRTISFTDRGIKKAEAFFHIENLADPQNLAIFQHIIQALRANYVMERDLDYVVIDGKIKVIDGLTGRIAEGVKYGGGLHQALEAKEGLMINRGSITIANITFQTLFNKYRKKGGLTGTGITEEREFRDVYSMDVVEVPTHRPIQRIDHPDIIYRTKEEKEEAVINEIREAHAKNQPVLVGTISVAESERLSAALTEAGIEHTVLNAKQLDKEAEIVSHAGEAGAVTISTSMAGRGTDIKIDKAARAAGGLKVIGAEHYESRRIDDQLRGRSGRQGDVGESVFIVSLEDDIMIRLGSARLAEIHKDLGYDNGESIQSKSLHKIIESAQQRIEFNNYGVRKNTIDYDKVFNEQRELLYEERDRILNDDNIHPNICRIIEHVISDIINKTIGNNDKKENWDLKALNQTLLPLIPLKPLTPDRLDCNDRGELFVQLKLEALNLYEKKIIESFESKNIYEIEKVVFLKCLDYKWMYHINNIAQLRQDIHLERYSGKKPLSQFKIYAYRYFDEMVRGIREDTVYILFHAQFGRDIKREQVASIIDRLEREMDASESRNTDKQPDGKMAAGSEIILNLEAAEDSGEGYAKIQANAEKVAELLVAKVKEKGGGKSNDKPEAPEFDKKRLEELTNKLDEDTMPNITLNYSAFFVGESSGGWNKGRKKTADAED